MLRNLPSRLVLVTRRAQRTITALVAALALVAVLLIALTLISPRDFADPGPEELRVDFGIDLPVDPEPSVLAALVAALGCVAGATVAMASSPLRARQAIGQRVDRVLS